MRKERHHAMTAEQYVKGAAGVAAWEFGSALLLHLVGFALSTALLAGLGISVLFTVSFAAFRGLALRRAGRQHEDAPPEPRV